jgi:DNA-binding NarL/FixJ family response regulator
MPIDEGYARLREAEARVLEDDRAGAAAALDAGLRLADAAGAITLRDELESLARRARLPAGGAEPEPATEGLDRIGLTDREREVLELLAAGLTNKQIGERLFMAEKTASVHVSRILAKLDVGSRVEAATAAQRLGLVP